MSSRGGTNSGQRSSNIELYRIIVMLLIVGHHYVVNSGLNGPISADPWSANSIFLILFGMWGKTGINCFVLITGYFMCQSRITVKKFAKLLLEVYFYRFLFYFIFLLAGYEEFRLTHFVKQLVPVTSISDGFTSCFLMFYLTIPFLNKLVHSLTEKEHQLLLVLCGIMYVFIGSVPQFTVRFNYVTWFCVLFFIGSYLRMYPKKWSSSTKLWGGLTALSILAAVGSVLGLMCWGIRTDRSGLTYWYWFVSDSNKILAVTVAVCSFMLFKNINIPYNKWINTIAASTFGVLQIHAQSDAMRQWLWRDTLNNVGVYGTRYAFIHPIVSTLLVFAVCSVMDMLRIRYLEKPLFACLSQRSWDRNT